MAESRGWPISTYTYLFAGYGFIRLLAGLYGGVLTDKYNTATLFVVHLIPMALGILGLALVPGLPAAAVFLFGTGDEYGQRHGFQKMPSSPKCTGWVGSGRSGACSRCSWC